MSETNQTQGSPNNPEVRFEERDANMGLIVIFGIGLFVLTIVALLVSNVFFNTLETQEQAAEPTPLPLLEFRPTPPPPRLQPNPIDRTSAEEELAANQAAAEEILTTYGWVDEEAGVARIPIDRAMTLWLEQQGDGGE